MKGKLPHFITNLGPVGQPTCQAAGVPRVHYPVGGAGQDRGPPCRYAHRSFPSPTCATGLGYQGMVGCGVSPAAISAGKGHWNGGPSEGTSDLPVACCQGLHVGEGPPRGIHGGLDPCTWNQAETMMLATALRGKAQRPREYTRDPLSWGVPPSPSGFSLFLGHRGKPGHDQS